MLTEKSIKNLWVLGGGRISVREAKSKNEMIKDTRREQILSAALKIFAARGFAATKISDIVRAGGISHGLVYHYFCVQGRDILCAV